MEMNGSVRTRRRLFQWEPVGAALVVLLWLRATPDACAQYYERPEYETLEIRSVYVGFMQRDFNPRSNNTLPESLAIDFMRIMPMIGFRQGAFDLTFGYTSYSLRGSSRSHIFLGAAGVQELHIGGRRPHAFLIPVLLSVDFTKAEAGGTEKDNFNIASVGIGLGFKYRYFGDNFDFSFHAVQTIHFATEGLSTGTGYSAASLAEALFVFRDIGLLDGIIAGYRLRYQVWGMNNSRFNYRSFAHGPFIGILF